jgi:hypothetical protein
MASVSQKVPIPLPIGGVQVDKSPREVGARGLLSAQNWIYRNGEFRVRPGLDPILPLGYNLFKQLDTPYTESLSYVNYASIFNTSSGDTEGAIDGLFDPASLLDEWRAWDAASEAKLATYLTFETYDGLTDPSFLNHGGDGYAEIAIEDAGSTDEVIITSPYVAISGGSYEGQIKICQQNAASVGLNYVRVELCFIRYTDITSPLYGEVLSADINTVFDLDWVAEAETEPIRVSAENDGFYSHAFLRITFRGGHGKDYFGFSEAMINRGTNNAAYSVPSVSGTNQVGTPMGMCAFEAVTGSPITVMSTNGSWWELDGDLKWAPVSGAVWSDDTGPVSVSPSAQPVFRVFDGALGGDSLSDDRYLIGVNGEANSMYWDGSGSAAEINLNNGESPDLTLVARCVAVSNNRILYGNIGDNLPDTIYWTEDLTITEWAPAGVTNQVRLADTPGEIVTMLEMGNLQTVIYKTDAIYMAIGQGMSPPFRFELRTASVDGPASPLSVVALSDGMHLYLSASGDVILFDGVRPRSLGSNLQSYIQGTMSVDASGRSFAMYDKEHKDVYFFYPPYGGGGGFHCVVVDVSGELPVLWPMRFNQEITAAGRLILNISKSIDQLGPDPIDSLPGLIDEFGSNRPVLAVLNGAGESFVFEGYTDAGVSIPHHLQTGLYDLGSITQWLTVKEIDHLFDASSGETIDVELLTTDFGGETVSDGIQTVDLIRGARKLSSHRATGRLFSMRMSGESTGKTVWLGSEASVAVRGFK